MFTTWSIFTTLVSRFTIRSRIPISSVTLCPMLYPESSSLKKKVSCLEKKTEFKLEDAAASTGSLINQSLITSALGLICFQHDSGCIESSLRKVRQKHLKIPEIVNKDVQIN